MEQKQFQAVQDYHARTKQIVSVEAELDKPEGLMSRVFYKVTWQGKQVRRSFQDFKRLRLRLIQSNKGMILPELPEDVSLLSFFFQPSSPAFFQLKTSRLHSFLARVISNQSLASHQALQTFMTCTDFASQESHLNAIYQNLNDINFQTVKDYSKAYALYLYSGCKGDFQLPDNIANYYKTLHQYKLVYERFVLVVKKIRQAFCTERQLLQKLKVQDKSFAQDVIKRAYQLESRLDNFRFSLKEALSALSVYQDEARDCSWYKTLKQITSSEAERRVYSQRFNQKRDSLSRMGQLLRKDMQQFMENSQRELLQISIVLQQIFRKK